VPVAGRASAVTFCDGSDDVAPPACTPTPRADRVITVGASAVYRAGFVLGGDITAWFQRSNSASDDFDRVRLSVFATLPLPWELVLSLAGAIQINSAVSLSEALSAFRPDDDENQNRLSVQLARELFGPIDGLLRWELYANEFATAQNRFFRQTAFVGLSFEIDTRR